MSSKTIVDTRTLKKIVLSEKPFSDRPVGLDELETQYGGIFSVEKKDANTFSLCADAKITMCAIEDRPLRCAKFTILLPTVRMAKSHYPLKEVLEEKSDEHSDIALIIANLLEIDDASYGAVAGDLRCDTTTGDPVFKVATNHHGVNFVMFYSSKKPEFSGIAQGRTAVQVGDIWMLMLPFYLVAKNL